MQCCTLLYARKSHEEDDRQILSLDAQEKECRLYAARYGVSVSQIIRESHSARRPGRPLFEQMLKQAEIRLKKGEPVRVLCHKPDRLLRNIADWARLNDLVDAGLELVFVSGSYENNAQGKLAFGINVIFAKYYVDNLSEEVKKGLKEKLERGEWPGWAPQGYCNVNEKNAPERIVVDAITGPLVRRGFELFATGEYSLGSLSRVLAEAGLVGKLTGRPLTKSLLRDRILSNPFYYGCFRYRGELYQGSHEPLISLELFERVQAVLHGKSRPKRFRHSFRFGGLLHCTRCLCAVVGDLKKGKYAYYRCSHRRGPCPEGYVREERLGEYLREQVGPVLRLRSDVEDALREAAEELVREGPAGVEAERTAVERRLRDLKSKENVLLDLRLAGNVSEEQYAAKREELTLEQVRLREKFAAFELPGIDPRQAVDWFIATCNSLEGVLADGEDDEVRELLRIVGSNYRYGDGKVDFEPVEPFTLAAQAQSRPNWRRGQNEVRKSVEQICAYWLETQANAA